MTGTPTESNRIPAEVQASRARAIGATPSPYPITTTSPTPPTSTVDGGGGGELVQCLEDRGVAARTSRSLTASHSAKRVRDAIAYFDALAGDKGPGLLVVAVREGRAPSQPKHLKDQEYAASVHGWLNEHFPDLRQSNGLPHPAARSAVFLLSPNFERDGLSVAEHGDRIRGAVRLWEERWGDPPSDEYVSRCCGARLRPHEGEEGTSWFTCSGCKRPADPCSPMSDEMGDSA